MGNEYKEKGKNIMKKILNTCLILFIVSPCFAATPEPRPSVKNDLIEHKIANGTENCVPFGQECPKLTFRIEKNTPFPGEKVVLENVHISPYKSALKGLNILVDEDKIRLFSTLPLRVGHTDSSFSKNSFEISLPSSFDKNVTFKFLTNSFSPGEVMQETIITYKYNDSFEISDVKITIQALN